MCCYSCSNAAFTCNKSSFSMAQPCSCALTSLKPAIPAYQFNLICPYYCPPIYCCALSPNHGVSCSAFNGYHPPVCITLPGHSPSCPPCPTVCPNTTCPC